MTHDEVIRIKKPASPDEPGSKRRNAMNTKSLKTALTLSLLGMSLGVSSPALADSAPVHECAAARIIRVAGVQYVPEAAMYWPAHLTPEAGTSDQIVDISYLGQPYQNHPAVHVSGAAQIARVVGAQYVPEASLYVQWHVEPESGASQMLRVAGIRIVPTAALYLGEWMPQSVTKGLQGLASRTQQ
jgi:hypothetical protein